jgi:hypothetical protein
MRPGLTAGALGPSKVSLNMNKLRCILRMRPNATLHVIIIIASSPTLGAHESAETESRWVFRADGTVGGTRVSPAGPGTVQVL